MKTSATEKSIAKIKRNRAKHKDYHVMPVKVTVDSVLKDKWMVYIGTPKSPSAVAHFYQKSKADRIAKELNNDTWWYDRGYTIEDRNAGSTPPSQRKP